MIGVWSEERHGQELQQATLAFAARSLSGQRCRYVFGRFKLFGGAQVAIGKPARPACVRRGSFVRGATMLPGGLTARRRPREFKLQSAGNFRSRYRRPTLPDGIRDVSFLKSAPLCLPVRIRRIRERPRIRSLSEARDPGSAPDRVLGLLDIKGAPGEPEFVSRRRGAGQAALQGAAVPGSSYRSKSKIRFALRPRMFRLACSSRNGRSQITLGVSKS